MSKRDRLSNVKCPPRPVGAHKEVKESADANTGAIFYSILIHEGCAILQFENAWTKSTHAFGMVASGDFSRGSLAVAAGATASASLLEADAAVDGVC